MGKVIAVCISEKKGTQKHAVPSAKFLPDWGIENDAHAGKWHRQVSLLSHDKVEAFRARGAKVASGAFGENLVVEGIDFAALPIGTRFQCNDVLLELTQIGKECHSHCEIFKKMGECIMPTQGVFTRVLKGGEIAEGDELVILPPALRAAVVTASDSGYVGQREDLSTPAAVELLEAAGYRVVDTVILPDDRAMLGAELKRLSDGDLADLIVTTGGTGFSRTDCTPEATMDVVERPTPGISEAMRLNSMKITPRAMLSRAAAGIRRQALIVNLPGSPKAVRECLEYILPPLSHGMDILKGTTGNCAR
ncbi:MOSC domain-containing protein [Pseudoflavonifractor sp. BIOML-A6]|nr:MULTISPECIES: MOSC domain-containing protein [unclassified Pseudoflavonifractor]MTQ97844.1 MOSC domain-containing protein [Pseudoflavonifractor sp. BIOML-A16]MTR04530.1 MOSC domain-containing protein [Pseudoflavonifractor sp. BIOML-A15]MTR33570.1 MOSC domain-containing protein [Pseudoflavonifractor sp. BIOML-A14]MTR71787.1 MOSC domain-containing protein [Pseudoflavonifractor sp. BIOML-A18]MTS62670.1 MOSC domain-containing protein [Pseudoflavonifractor sp. BIOML-A5]MTS71736.1 MOSC domain-co